MTKYLIVSFEASDVDAKTAKLQQVSLTICESTQDVSLGGLTMLKETSFFVDDYAATDFFDISANIPFKDIPAYKNLSNYEGLKRYSLEDTLGLLQKAVNFCSYVVVHNGLDYHIPILKRSGISFENKVIIDTSEHIAYTASIKTRKLNQLCAEHNFLLYGARASIRTVCLNQAMLDLVNLYPLNVTVDNAWKTAANSLYVVANIPYEKNDAAKALGFKYDASRKHWYVKTDVTRYNELVTIMGSECLQLDQI